MRPVFAAVVVLFAALAQNVHAQQSAQRPPVAARVTVLAESRDSICWEVAQSPANPKLLACTSSTNDLRVINTETHTATVLVPGIYAGQPVWSRAGDRIAWQGLESHLWSIAVDPRTGARGGDARRISIAAGANATFSPDGKRIAFVGETGDRRRSAMVMPADGGQETKLAELNSNGALFTNGPLSWSSDGAGLFYPSRSVDKVGRITADVYRVAVDGRSKPVHVASLGDEIFRGMSPDGRFMISGPHADRQGWALGTVTIRDATGASLGRATTPRGAGDVTDSGDDWTPRTLQIIARRGWTPRTLRTVDLATGETRELARSAGELAGPRWSPDGKRFSVQILDGERVVLAVMNADGTDRRVLRTTGELLFDGGHAFGSGNSWSPDSRSLVYISEARRLRQLHVIDVSTNKDVVLVDGAFTIASFHWLDNSRGVRYMRVEGTGSQARRSIHEASLDGSDRELRTLEASGIIRFVGADWVLSAAAGTLEPVHGGMARRVHPPMGDGYVALSDDERWLAFAPNGRGSASAPAQYDIVSVDGGAMQTLKLAPGLASRPPFFVDDGRSVLIPSANTGSNERPPSTPAQVLSVPIGGGPSRIATTLPPRERFSGGAVSPDGKTLLYVGDAPEQQQILSLDLSEIVAAKRTRKQ